MLEEQLLITSSRTTIVNKQCIKMNLSLIKRNSTNTTSTSTTTNINNNNNSNNNNNNSSSSNNNDIENDNCIRIANNSILDIVKADKTLVVFINIIGYYCLDDTSSIIFRVLSRIWQCFILISGSVGFCWLVFVYGIPDMLLLYKSSIPSNDASSIEIFIYVGYVLNDSVLPILQVSTLIYGVYSLTMQLNQSADVIITSKLLTQCRRDAIIYFSIMVIWLIVYFCVSYKFNNLSLLFYNYAVTCYLTLVMIFTSLTLRQVESIQGSMIIKIDDSLSCEEYMIEKEKIKYLYTESYYSTQILTLVAFFNVLVFIFFIWCNRYELINMSAVWASYSYKDMVAYDFLFASYYFKEIVFFYYILFKVAAINDLNDILTERLANKCWQLGDKSSDVNQYMLMYQNSVTFRIIFKLGTLVVRKDKLLLTILGLITYSIGIFSHAKSSI